MTTEFEIPKLFERHVFVCTTQRPPGHPRGSCAAAGAGPLWEKLGARLGREGLADIGFTGTGCLGFCSAGPLMVIYPEGIWYRPETVADIDEIVDQHIKRGNLVERLVVILKRS